jgi:hypothetical protein
MMLTPRTIKNELAGKKFAASNSANGSEVWFQFPRTFDGWPRRGGEGIVAPIVCKHPQRGDIPSIIKFFDTVLPERAKRQTHLLSFGLVGKHDWLYEGVPYAWIDITLDGHRIYGHVARHVGYTRKGDDFRIMRDKVEIDDFTVDNRRAMAGQLCSAVLGLEKLKIVHGDLSPANIVIGKQSDNDVHCVLIDYDGFYSPNVPKLPRQHDGKQLRMLGSPGYQHPSLMRKIKSDTGTDDSLFVANDRFALGVLCFEIMVWTSQISKSLVGRAQLIDEDELANGRLVVPAAVKAVWPEGLKLLEQSVAEPDVNSLPGPEDWLRTLGFLGADWRSLRKDWATTAFLKIYRRRGNQAPVPQRLVHFESSSGQGDFTSIDNRLAPIDYSFKNEHGRCVAFSVKIKSPSPVLIKRDGITKNLGVTPEELEIGPGDQVLTDDWIFEFQDASLGTRW